MPVQQGGWLTGVERYEARAMGGWLGKNIGGTLGMPFEGNPSLLTLFYFDPVPTEPQPNDDFEIQLIWLAMLRERGPRLTPADFPIYFDRHLTMTISEYQMAVRNHRDAIRPPVSGAFNNWFIHGMGAAIRSEIWAMIAPGRPELAAAYAYMDAIMDHAGDGVWGEMFLAALESLALGGDRDRPGMVERALRFIPAGCQVSQVARLVLREWARATDPVRVRHMVLAEVGHPMDFTWVPTNLGFILIGFLYGENFGDALCLAVNCGYDTDCTGASLGALLGMMAGREEIPARWLDPVGERVVISEAIRDLEYPPDIAQLTAATAELASQTFEDEGLREHLYRWTGLEFLRPKTSLTVGTSLAEIPSQTRVRLAADEYLALDLDYLDRPTISSEEPKPLELILTNAGEKALDCRVKVEPGPELELLPDGPDNNLAAGIDGALAPGATARLCFAVRLRPGLAPAGGADQMRVKVTCAGHAPVQSEFGLVRRVGWWVSEPIAATDRVTRERIERAGMLTAGVGIKRRFLDGYSLNELIPAPGQVIYAQVEVELDTDEGQRVIANNSGPIRVWLDGRPIIDKAHRMHGIMPSWHLQSNPLHGYTMDTFGCADVLLRAGRHRFMVRLEGRRLSQDALFYLAGMRLGPQGELISERRMMKPFSQAHWVTADLAES